MIRAIVISVACGIVAGYFFLPDWFIAVSEPLMVVSLCGLLFFVGFDIGRENTIVERSKGAGWRIGIFPLAIIAGTFAGSLVGALVLPSLGIRDALAVGAGFGWYSLAPVMLMDYSAEVSAISFVHNVMREVFGILLIPIVAKKIGYIETVSLPGASAMDVCLPIVEKCTRSDIVLYSFAAGVVLTTLTPVFVGLIAG